MTAPAAAPVPMPTALAPVPMPTAPVPSAPVPMPAAPAPAPYPQILTPAAPVVAKTMTAKANGVTYDQYVAAGWTDDMLVSEGLMLR